MGHNKVLITGGSGLVGRHLSVLLLSKGYSVSHLSRSGNGLPGIAVSPVNVPSFLLRTVLGEMSDVVLKGSRVSGEKIRNEGYDFQHRDLSGALNEVLNIHSL